ncbi:MAG: DUF2807 domain-containing protein [Bacteroidales bacterium]|nr:DUF2807 domain-containing protein [Bacteroidales bacterium]
MKKIMIALVAAVAAVSCININTRGLNGLNFSFGGKTIDGEGPVETRSYDLEGFDRMVINGHFDIDYTQSENWQVSLTTQENIFEYMNFSVEGGKLILSVKDSVKVNADKFDVKISAPLLSYVEVNGAADIEIGNGLSSAGPVGFKVNGACDIDIDGLKCSACNVKINGAGDFNASGIDADELKLEINGAADAVLSGKVRKAYFEVNGAGEINARGLEAEEIDKSTSGLAKIKTK